MNVRWYLFTHGPFRVVFPKGLKGVIFQEKNLKMVKLYMFGKVHVVCQVIYENN